MKIFAHMRTPFLLIAMLLVFASSAMLAGCHEGDGEDTVDIGSGGDDGGTASPAGLLSFTAATHSVAETAATAEVAVARSGGAEGEVTIRYRTVDATALAGDDYVQTSGVLNWANGDDADKAVSVVILNSRPEGASKGFILELSDPAGGAVIGAQPSMAVSIAPHIASAECLAEAGRQDSFIGVYEACSRNPENADEIVAQAEAFSGVSGPTPVCCEAQASRASAAGALIGNIARQPEFEDQLMAYFLRLSGQRPEAPCCLAKGSRIDGAARLVEAVARQPELRDLLVDDFLELNGPIDIDATCTDISSRWMAAVGAVIENITRQPEASEQIQSAFLEAAGSGPSAATKLGCKAQAARMEAYGRLFVAISNSPEMAVELRALALSLLGPAAEELCTEAVTAGYGALTYLYAAVARTPDAAEQLLAAAAEMGTLPPL